MKANDLTLLSFGTICYAVQGGFIFEASEEYLIMQTCDHESLICCNCRAGRFKLWFFVCFLFKQY